MACGLGQRHDLEGVVRTLQPTVLIGASDQAGAFTEAAIRAMASFVERPVIFPLSNPTSQSEATPADLLAWTKGRALVATGRPFEPVTYAGRTFRIGQCNNTFIFPGIGLGALVAEAREVSDGMCRVAAECLADQVSREDLEAGSLFPLIGDLQRVVTHVAEAVVREARDSGLGRPLPDEAIQEAVASARWEPRYLPLDPD